MDASKKDAPEKPVEKEENKESPAAAKPPSPTVKSTVLPITPTRRGPSIWTHLLRWLMGILILFGLGALTVVTLLYVPARRELDEARQKLDTLTTRSSSDLQTANEEINRLSSLETSNKDLQTQLDKANLSLALQQIRFDIASAQLALANKDTTKAKTALSATAETIKKLESLLPQSQREVIASLQARLKMVLDELKENAYAANSDLDVMTNTLLELENALYR